MELTSAGGVQGFGYIMPLRESRYKGIVDMMKRRVEPTFRALATSGLELSHSYLQLHSKGLCYRDISFGNVFFDPITGATAICDNDNVAVDGKAGGGVLGTPRFMAPEVVRGDALPSTQTDLFSLAVLLFYMLLVHHPLEGKKESSIKCFDLPAMTKLYGTEPVFIFDPNDRSNEPVAGFHDNALAFWPIYPQFLRDVFTRAFTQGIRDPRNGRVRESEWRALMVRLRDSILYCRCGSENFYDPAALQASGGKLPVCWSCGKELQLPWRIRVGKSVVMLNHDTQLFPHHVDDQRMYDFSKPLAAMTQHPTNPNIWGLKNISGEKWVSKAADGNVKDVEPGRSVTLAVGTKILFGKAEGEIRI
jgi:serine/threonine protein kinase